MQFTPDMYPDLTPEERNQKALDFIEYHRQRVMSIREFIRAKGIKHAKEFHPLLDEMNTKYKEGVTDLQEAWDLIHAPQPEPEPELSLVLEEQPQEDQSL